MPLTQAMFRSNVDRPNANTSCTLLSGKEFSCNSDRVSLEASFSSLAVLDRHPDAVPAPAVS